jgi:hypothetical protein
MKYKPCPDLPSAMVNLLTRDLHVTQGKYSVTGLIAPPRIMQLRKRHDDEIEVDPIDRIWLLFGTLTHSQLEAVEGDNTLSEERLSAELDGVRFSGTADVYENETIYDYKTTSVYSVKDGMKDDWVAQLSIYAWLYRCHGFSVKGGKIVAILKDWSKTKAKRDEGYPAKPVAVIPVPLWSHDVTESYIKERIRLHEEAAKLADDDLPCCTDEERWAQPSKYAVMKKGRKSAVKLHDSEFEAQVMLDGLSKDHYIEHRKGKFVRCEDYCECNKWCKFYIKEEA